MADEGDAHLTIGNEHRLVGLAGARRHGRVADQFAKLLGALAQRGILNRVLQHGMPEFLFANQPAIPRDFCSSVLQLTELTHAHSCILQLAAISLTGHGVSFLIPLFFHIQEL